jgi:hypothetical protein
MLCYNVNIKHKRISIHSSFHHIAIALKSFVIISLHSSSHHLIHAAGWNDNFRKFAWCCLGDEVKKNEIKDENIITNFFHNFNCAYLCASVNTRQQHPSSFVFQEWFFILKMWEVNAKEQIFIERSPNRCRLIW